MDVCDTVAEGDSSCHAHGDGDEVINADSNAIGSSTERISEVHDDTDKDDKAEGSLEAVRLLDEELAELEQLMRLQKRKVDALERLRRQWLSGERKLPDFPPIVPSPEAFLGDDILGDAALVAGSSQGFPNTKRGHQGNALQVPPLLSQQLPTGQFEHYTTPHNSFQSSTPVVAAEMLSFRLKGSKNRPSSGSGSGSGIGGGGSKQRTAGGVRSGFLNVFAYLHADGVVRLRDADGEEIVAFDSGHARPEATVPFSSSFFSSAAAVSDSPAESDEAQTPAAAVPGAVVVGMAADASEASPVLVTAGVDGTARVHSLAVHYRDRQLAGAGRGRERSGGGKGRKTPPGAHGDSGSGGDEGGSGRSSTSRSSTNKQPRRSKNSGGAEDKNGGGDGGPPRAPSVPKPPATVMGVGVAVEFKMCLGSACRGSVESPRIQASGVADESVDSGEANDSGGEEGGDSATTEGLLDHGEAATVTSMDAFYHRSLGTTVVIAGYSSGGVRFFHAGNGTELGSAETGSRAVLAVKRGGQSIAFSDGEDVHFVSASKFTGTPGRVCRGSRRGGVGVGVGGDGVAVTALAFDAVSTAVLYVGFDNGDVMAYDSRFQEMDSSYTCLPSHRLPPPLHEASPLTHAGAAPGSASLSSGDGRSTNSQGDSDSGRDPPEAGCDSISSIRGYAIVSRGPLLSVYNTTDEASRLLFTRRARTTHETPAGAAERQLQGHCGEGVFAASGGEAEEGTGGIGAATAPATSSGWRHWSAMSSTASGEVFLAEAPRCSTETVVHRAVLPYERNLPDMSWMRVPIVLLGLLVVAVTQVYSRRAAKSAIGRTTSRRKTRGGRAWKGDDSLSDHDDGGGSLSADRLSRLRGAGRRDWDRLGAGGGSSERSLAPRQGYGDPWEQDSD